MKRRRKIFLSSIVCVFICFLRKKSENLIISSKNSHPKYFIFLTLSDSYHKKLSPFHSPIPQTTSASADDTSNSSLDLDTSSSTEFYPSQHHKSQLIDLRFHTRHTESRARYTVPTAKQYLCACSKLEQRSEFLNPTV